MNNIAIIKLIKRLWYWLEEYHLTILIDNQSRALEFLRDEKTRTEVFEARKNARKERTRVRGEYNATFPPGKRIFWKTA